MIVIGFLAFFVAPFGVYRYRDQAAELAQIYAREHRHDFNGEEFSRVMDDSLARTRPKRATLFVVQFGGFVLACWGASKLRHEPEGPKLA